MVFGWFTHVLEIASCIVYSTKKLNSEKIQFQDTTLFSISFLLNINIIYKYINNKTIKTIHQSDSFRRLHNQLNLFNDVGLFR